MLVAMAGVERCFYVEIAGQRSPGRGEVRGENSQRTTAVQYVKFPLGPTLGGELKSRQVPVVLGVEHPAYRAETVLSAPTLSALLGDLD